MKLFVVLSLSLFANLSFAKINDEKKILDQVKAYLGPINHERDYRCGDKAVQSGSVNLAFGVPTEILGKVIPKAAITNATEVVCLDGKKTLKTTTTGMGETEEDTEVIDPNDTEDPQISDLLSDFEEEDGELTFESIEKVEEYKMPDGSKVAAMKIKAKLKINLEEEEGEESDEEESPEAKKALKMLREILKNPLDVTAYITNEHSALSRILKVEFAAKKLKVKMGGFQLKLISAERGKE